VRDRNRVKNTPARKLVGTKQEGPIKGEKAGKGMVPFAKETRKEERLERGERGRRCIGKRAQSEYESKGMNVGTSGDLGIV